MKIPLKYGFLYINANLTQMNDINTFIHAAVLLFMSENL